MKMAQAFSPEMKDADLDWESITGMIQEGEQGKIVEVEDEVHHKTVEVWVECRASAAGTNRPSATPSAQPSRAERTSSRSSSSEMPAASSGRSRIVPLLVLSSGWRAMKPPSWPCWKP